MYNIVFLCLRLYLEVVYSIYLFSLCFSFRFNLGIMTEKIKLRPRALCWEYLNKIENPLCALGFFSGYVIRRIHLILPKAKKNLRIIKPLYTLFTSYN